MSFKDEWDASRRLFILRLLVEVGGEANESNIFRAVQRGGFAQASRDTVRDDLDRLKKARCTTESWLNESVCVVKLTERGEDAAYGRVEVPGVETSPRWVR